LVLDNPSFDSNFSFIEHFMTNQYDAPLIDKALNGNILFFTMVYVKQRLDW
jgi:hypothetical protein